MIASMEGIKYGKPEPFAIPNYDYAPVKAVAQATDLSRYYSNLLDGALEMDEDEFTYGIPPSIVKRLVERATNGYDWQEWSDKIRDMGNHYKLKVSGIEDQDQIGVHFVHCRSDAPDAIPLLLVHGWPGSIVEFLDISKILSKRYHVVMPSIPGYAFSDAPKKPAKGKGGVPWNYTKTAQVFNAVMLSLGYEHYVTQGGDWGSMLTRHVAQCFPENVKALHLNYFSGVTTKPDGSGELTELEKRGIERLQDFKNKGSAYSEMQGTTPYTLGGALAASPVSLMIYIGEKMYRWSSPQTHPSLDHVITNCMLYWFTGSITSSFWLYYMRKSGDNSQHQLLETTSISQPVAFGCGPSEIHWPVRKAFELQLTNIKSWEVLERGGHFLAMEAPEVLARDMDRHFQSEEVRLLFGLSRSSTTHRL